jgi:hypothetical protein
LRFLSAMIELVQSEVLRRPTMKRSITRWTMAVATAGVLSLPVSSFARTTQDPQPQPQQQQPPAQPQPQQPQPEQAAPTPQQPAPTPQPSAAATQPQAEKEMTPQDHLKKAQEAANEISTMSVPAKDRGDVEQLKKHLANLDKASSSSAATPTETAKKGDEKASAQPNWGTEVAAIDKIISGMVGSESATPSSPQPTGTSGTSKPAATLDDATRAKLMEVRTHITAYAAGMAGTSTPKTETTAATETPAARPEPAMTQPPAQSPTPAAPPAQNRPASQSPTPTPQPDPNAAQPPAGQPPAAQAQPQSTDTEAAHRHLLAARETLAQLTQLPAAAQLSGEPRNQIAQLITNFNELISAQSNWKASYDKVSANLTTLLGPANSDNEATAGAPTPNAGATPTPAPGAPAPNAGAAPAPGAVGTSGTATVELDPAIRAKLVDLRKNLNDFKKAAGAAGQ